MLGPKSELEMPIWAICWPHGIWPQFGCGVTYDEAVIEQKVVTEKYPNEAFSIVTAEAASRFKKRDVETTETI